MSKLFLAGIVCGILGTLTVVFIAARFVYDRVMSGDNEVDDSTSE